MTPGRLASRSPRPFIVNERKSSFSIAQSSILISGHHLHYAFGSDAYCSSLVFTIGKSAFLGMLKGFFCVGLKTGSLVLAVFNFVSIFYHTVTFLKYCYINLFLFCWNCNKFDTTCQKLVKSNTNI